MSRTSKLWGADATADAPADQTPGPRLDLIAQVVSAYLSHNQTPMTQIGDVIKAVAAGLGADTPQHRGTDKAPAVNPKRSISDDWIICLEDGKKLKMLKRYLRSQYDLTPEQYREKWGLPHDYPMVAPNYSKQRSQFAKNIGLGTVARKGPRGPKKPK